MTQNLIVRGEGRRGGWRWECVAQVRCCCALPELVTLIYWVFIVESTNSGE